MPRSALTGAFFLLALSAVAGCAPPDYGGLDDGGLAPDELSLTPTELLGKRLFEDTALSEPPGESCASCHDPSRAFTGNAGSPVDAVALGSRPGQLGTRNVPTAMYASFSPRFHFEADGDEVVAVGGQFWDGRAGGLGEQAKGPFLNPREMNDPDVATVVAKVRASAYAPLFRAVYGDDALDAPAAAYDRIAHAIAEFEATPRFHPFSSRFDDYLRGTGTLDATEQRGLALFMDPAKGNCIACHAGTPGSHAPSDWLFTDFTYDALGLPRNAAIPDDADPAYFDLGLCAQEGLASRAPAGFDVEATCGAFKVPTLRNVARTAPYGHNGVFATLRDVVRFYATRDTSPELWYRTGDGGRVEKFDDLPEVYRRNVNTEEVPYDRRPGDAPRLDDDEIDAIVAFLGTLDDR